MAQYQDTDINEERKRKGPSLADLLTQARGGESSENPDEMGNAERMAKGYAFRPEGDETSTYNRAMGAMSQYEMDERQDRKSRSDKLREMAGRVPEAISSSGFAAEHPDLAAGASTALETARDLAVPEYDPHSVDLPAVGGTVRKLKNEGMPAAASKRADMASKRPSQEQLRQEWNALSGPERDQFGNDISGFLKKRKHEADLAADEAEARFLRKGTYQGTASEGPALDYSAMNKKPRVPEEEMPSIDYRKLNKRNEQR